jgi:hypothetical protein
LVLIELLEDLDQMLGLDEVLFCPFGISSSQVVRDGFLVNFNHAVEDEELVSSDDIATDLGISLGGLLVDSAIKGDGLGAPAGFSRTD